MTEEKTSRLPAFYKKNQGERLEILKGQVDLSETELRMLEDLKGLDFETANRMIENVIGVMPLPLAVATNFKVNGREVIVPMALEEPSVVAAASNAAKLALPEGFESKASEPVMIGQIQIVDVPDMETALQAIELNKSELMAICDRQDSTLIKFGGGTRKLEAKVIESQRGQMLVIHIHVDVRDAMGANAVNTMAEAITNRLEELTQGKVRLRIISNLAVHRTVKAKAVWKKELLGEDTIEGILDAFAFAEADQYRCTTHNKGIMNGIDAVIIATGNDFRAIESGAHSFAALNGKYHSLTKYHKNEDGDLVGEIELPMAVGLVGGATRTHPIARLSIKLLGVKKASELAEIVAAVGLAQNFAALRALATEGIQRGHMRLHSKNMAVTAGCPSELIDEVAAKMVTAKEINVQKAQELIKELTGKDPNHKGA
jgi:hydroxymethylglutaryl-CoA reductase